MKDSLIINPLVVNINHNHLDVKKTIQISKKLLKNFLLTFSGIFSFSLIE